MLTDVQPIPAASKALAPLRQHPQLYEINTWPWLDRLSKNAGHAITLGTIPDAEWDRLQALGFDLIYLMGVWSRSRIGRTLSRSLPNLFSDYDAALPDWTMQDVVGSPYSIQVYEPEPHIGSWIELAALRERLHVRNMRLVLDFVPNHTGLDHDWIREHPDYYIRGTIDDYKKAPQDFYVSELGNGNVNFIACGRDPNFPAWRDTAQLNYFNPRLRQAVIAELGSISQFCDGVRCDMAMLLLNDTFAITWKNLLQQWKKPEREFWPQAVEALPGFLWMAECYSDTEWQMQSFGFDFTYDKVFLDRLRDRDIEGFRLHLRGASPDFRSHSARFLENHDEARSAKVFADRLPSVAVLMATAPGLHFFHEGQFDGRTLRIPVQLARAQEESPDPNVHAIYERILSLTDDAVFHEGTWQFVDVHDCGDGTFANLVAYLWRLNSATQLIVANLGAGTSCGKISLPSEVLSTNQMDFIDDLNDQTYTRERTDLEQNGLIVVLGANGAHMFDVRAAVS